MRRKRAGRRVQVAREQAFKPRCELSIPHVRLFTDNPVEADILHDAMMRRKRKAARMGGRAKVASVKATA